MVRSVRHLKRWLVLALLSCMAIVGLSIYSGFDRANAASAIQPPLSTRRAQIVDARGNVVLLRGVNWFGLETETHAPHGLWSRDYKEMLAQIRSLGYNVIRLPYSVQGVRTPSISGVNFDVGSNRDLLGKTSLEVMDLIIQEAGRQGIFILLDSHRLNNQRIPELWYGDGFTEEDWINTWTMLAERYRNQTNIIGADLKNEPHGQASWGTGDRATDWRLAAERAGNAILRVNPNWLIVVEGVEKNVPGQRLSGHWWGGNLEGVRDNPVRISNPRKLVYSPHEYGPGVFNQPWFSDPTFPQNLLNRWEVGFNFIATRGIAPIFVGEFGGREVEGNSKEAIWQQKFVDFIKQKNLSFSYWSWNPNSGDTGGILKDDWKTIDVPKQNLLNRLLPVPFYAGEGNAPIALPPAPRPTPSPSVRPSPVPQPSLPRPSQPTPAQPPSANNGLSVAMAVHSDWQTGFCVNLRVTNPGRSPMNNWQLGFRMNQAVINNSWNGTFNQQGGQYRVTPADWARSLQPGQTADLGFCATKQGSDYRPTGVTVIAP